MANHESLQLPIDILAKRLEGARSLRGLRYNDYFGLTEADEDTEMDEDGSYLLSGTNGTNGLDFSMPPTPTLDN
jgi:hypothetical protein